MNVGLINYLEQYKKNRSDCFPISQPNRKKFGIFCIDPYPIQCKEVNYFDFLDYFFILRLCDFNKKLPFFLFNDYRPPLCIFFCSREHALIRQPLYIIIIKLNINYGFKKKR